MTEQQRPERVRRAVHERTLVEREALGDILARMDDGFVVLDINECFVYVNRKAAQIIRRRGDRDLLGCHLWSELPLLVGTSFEGAYRQATTSQKAMVHEGYFAPDRRWFEGRLYPSAHGMSIYFSDITARKTAEEALRLSEQRYRLAAAAGHVWDWDIAAGRVNFPPVFWQLLGWPPPPDDEVVARFAELLHPQDLPIWRHTLREHLARNTAYELHFRIRHADGEWRWFRSHGLAARDTTGRAIYMAGTIFEVTQRMRALEALSESEAYRRSIFEQLADAVLLVDHDLRIIDANPQALRMFGYSRDELLLLNMRDLLASFEHGRLAEEAVRMKADLAHLSEWEHVRKDGSHFPAEVSAGPMDKRRFVAVIRDITTRRQSEQTMLAVQVELSELTHRLMSQDRLTTRRVALALHDHVGQTLAVARLNLEACIAEHVATMPAAMKEHSIRLGTLLDQAVREVRQVLLDLRPPLLEEQGLAAALGNEIGRRDEVLLEADDAASFQRWPDDVEYCAFMVAREAITNAQRHAGASLVRVVLEAPAGSLCLAVIDDGKGLPTHLVHGRPGHLGIVGMRERAIAIGARFAIEAAPGGGTSVALRWDSHAP